MIPRIMGRTTLPPIVPDEDIRAIVDATLDKREPDPEIHARFYAPEAVAARAARDALRRYDDWPALARFRGANAAVCARPDVVMIGDSLTEIWQLAMPELFDDAVLNRGISGQTSPQILLRFMADVVDLAPRCVHILCGGNDIAGNTGPNLPEDFQRNVRAMADLAAANRIEVLLASILPAGTVPWQPDARPLEWIPHLNAWLRDLAESRGLVYVDYHAVLDDGHGALQERYSTDGVHVTRAAYREMTKVFEQARAAAA